MHSFHDVNSKFYWVSWIPVLLKTILKVYSEQQEVIYIYYLTIVYYLWFMVFNATFNNISVISWWSVLLVEEKGVLGENHRPVASH